MKSDLYIFNKILTEFREKCINHDSNAGERLQIKGLEKTLRDYFKKYYNLSQEKKEAEPTFKKVTSFDIDKIYREWLKKDPDQSEITDFIVFCQEEIRSIKAKQKEDKKDPFETMVPENFWEDISKEEEEFCSDCPIKEPKNEDCLICNKEEEE